MGVISVPVYAFRQYANYFESQWMRNNAVPKRLWNNHTVAVGRITNNDTEGWNKCDRAVAKTAPDYSRSRPITSTVRSPPVYRRRHVDRRTLRRTPGSSTTSTASTSSHRHSQDIDRNDVVDTPRLLNILAMSGMHVICRVLMY